MFGWTNTPQGLTDVAIADGADSESGEISALRHLASRLQMALEGAGQGVWDHNMVTGETYFSDTWKRMRGYQPEDDVDAVGGPWLDRLHPEDRPRILDIIQRQNRGEVENNAFEYRERHRDGHWIWIFSRGRPVERYPDGSVARTLGTDTDISELKAVEFALAEEKERLLVTLRSIAEGLVSVDANGCITNFNSAAGSITGCTPDEAFGLKISDVLDMRSGAGFPITEALVGQALDLQTGITLPDDTILVRRDGSRRRAHCSISPVIIRSGAMGLVIVFRDTTQEHEFREQLHYSATHDPLTHLPNRLAFGDAIEQAVMTAGRERRQHVLCLIDLDGFKCVNDGAGHAAGDEVLKAVAICLARRCNAGDLVARLGGDEFAILLADAGLRRAESVCARITRDVAALDFTFDGRSYRIGASIGIKSVKGSDESVSKLMSAADKACYEAKSLGKGRWISADRSVA
jgi:diguanylate cyclase (GGDEF)-like protein/PAS domain S-box-containing protein